MARATGSSHVRFGVPDRGKESSSRGSKGRPCAEPGCTTVLSTYNESDRCWLHSPPSYRHPLYRT
jgi:hypothetical protein